jgi:ribonuclease E
MKKEMLINVLQAEECRIAIVEDGVLEELYVERASQESYVNNIYKGRIVNIEPSIQAAFVDFGIGRNGFLHVSDVDPVYYRHLEGRQGGNGDRRDRDRDRGDRGGRRGRDRDRDRDDRRRPFEPVPIPSGIDALPPEFEGPSPVESAAAPTPADSFGAGLDLDEPSAEQIAEIEDRAPVEGEQPPASPAPEAAGPTAEEVSTETTEVEAGAPFGEETETPAEEPAEPRRRGRSRSKKPAESEESAEEKPKRRRSTRKKDGDEPGNDDDKPRFMPSAERRTAGDEPEVEGTEGGGFVFDPFAPNDRFNEDAPTRREPEARVEPDRDLPADEVDSAFVVEEDTLEDLDDDDDLLEDSEGDFPGRRGGRGRDRGRGRERGGRGRGPRRGFGRDGRDARPKPPIQEIFKRGQEVIVQVIKEGIGTKGPTLSTYISIAGRYLVLMPSLNRLAVSRKIANEETRGRLKEALGELEPPKGIGFIIRTAAIDRDKKELKNDLAYLVRLWEVFCRRVKKVPGPVEIYRESDMITRTIRDIFTSDIDTIWVDEEQAFTQAQEFLNVVMPRYAERIKFFNETEPIFHRFRVEDEIHRIQEKKVPLPMGGSIVIEQTEALVAIDVNSGNFRADNNAEETAYQMNLHAAKEIGRQLRLRDLGGVIVNDFIDMKDEKHRRSVERALRDALRRDRARTKILKTSAFGVIEMTRQRIRPSLKRSVYHECAHCRANGSVKTAESMSIEIMRLLQLAAYRQNIRQLTAAVHPEVATYLLNKKRREILAWEEQGKMQVAVLGRPGVSPEFLEMQCHDANGTEVRLLPGEAAVRPLPPRGNGGRERDRDDSRRGRGGRDRDRDRDRDRGRGRGRGRDRDRD